MGTLSKLQEQQYAEIKEIFKDQTLVDISDEDDIRMRSVLQLLEEQGYIQDMKINGGNVYRKMGNFSDFETWHKDQKREERKLNRREWRIAIVSAIIGAAIGLIPTIIQWLGGK